MRILKQIPCDHIPGYGMLLTSLSGSFWSNCVTAAQQFPGIWEEGSTFWTPHRLPLGHSPRTQSFPRRAFLRHHPLPVRRPRDRSTAGA